MVIVRQSVVTRFVVIMVMTEKARHMTM